MSSRHLSVRLDADIMEWLDAESQRTGEGRSQVAKRLLEEGLRMAAHPGIVFRSGPAGRRAGLAGGPDVWEVVRIARELPPAENRIQQAAELSGLGPAQLRVALDYYAEYTDEIDAWLSRVDKDAKRAEARWHRTRSLFGS
jgi:hypothetical protein